MLFGQVCVMTTILGLAPDRILWRHGWWPMASPFPILWAMVKCILKATTFHGRHQPTPDQKMNKIVEENGFRRFQSEEPFLTDRLKLTIQLYLDVNELEDSLLFTTRTLLDTYQSYNCLGSTKPWMTTSIFTSTSESCIAGNWIRKWKA